MLLLLVLSHRIGNNQLIIYQLTCTTATLIGKGSVWKSLMHLAQKTPELQPLYANLVRELWSPSTEADLLGEKIYQDLPAKLWRALAPRKEREEEAAPFKTGHK
jgi:hypothetical protein